MRNNLRFLLTFTPGCLLLISPKLAQAGILYNGVAAGDATTNSVILWTRTIDNVTNQGVSSHLTAQISTDPNFGSIFQSVTGTTDSNRDYIWKPDITNLNSGIKYYYRFLGQGGEISPVGTFTTAPNPTAMAAVRFGFSGDADGKWRPYGSTVNFGQNNLDYFVFLGDTIYETASNISAGTANPLTNPTQALADYHRKYLEQLQPTPSGSFTGLQTLFASQGNYTLLDNHELGNQQFINGGAPQGTPAGAGVNPALTANDVNNTGSYINQTPGFKTLLQAYSDYQPIREKTVSAHGDPRSNGTQQLYFAQQWGANSIFINLDDRSYRDILLKTTGGEDDTGPRADNPNRTMLGATQLAWLKQTLLDAQAKNITWKIIALSSPIDEMGINLGLDFDGAKSWIGGYRYERNELLKFIADNHILNVVFLSTDDHLNRINELTYLTDLNDPSSKTVLPNAFTVVAGPIGAGGPDTITDHSFSNIQSLANLLANIEQANGANPIGLDPLFPGLSNIYREGDPNAEINRQPVDFFSPDTFNYVTFDISRDGKTLSVNTYGINSYAANTFPEPNSNNPVRRILGFQIQAATVPEPRSNLGLIVLAAFGSFELIRRHV